MIMSQRVLATLRQSHRRLLEHICQDRVPQQQNAQGSERISHCSAIQIVRAWSPHALAISSLRRPLASSASNLRQQMISIYFDPMEVPATADMLKPVDRATEKDRPMLAAGRVAAPVVLAPVDPAQADPAQGEATLVGQIREALTRAPNQPLATTNRHS